MNLDSSDTFSCVCESLTLWPTVFLNLIMQSFAFCYFLFLCLFNDKQKAIKSNTDEMSQAWAKDQPVTGKFINCILFNLIILVNYKKSCLRHQ